MRLFHSLLLFFILVLKVHLNASAQESVVFADKGNLSSVFISLIDSITVPAPSLFNLHLIDRDSPIIVPADSALFHCLLPDTLLIDYQEDEVKVHNPHLDYLRVQVQSADVTVSAFGKQPFIIQAKGQSTKGRLIIDSDTICTLILDNLNLTSRTGSAVYFKQKHRLEILLPNDTESSLADAIEYTPADSTDESNAALFAKGSLTFTGAGTLNIFGHYRHAVASNKNITVNGGTVNILGTMKDGIHCDKYLQTGGTVSLFLSHEATKGIKAKKELEIIGGNITGEARADLKIKDGETTYCTLLKSDSCFVMKAGEINMKHYGKGGRCISVNHNFLMTAGHMELECHGDGGSYLTAANDSDYYTPKCITVDGCTCIERGQIKLLATGRGGKGLDCSDTLIIGRQSDDFISEESLLLQVETRGTALVDNVNEDYRKGCPKAVKCDNDIYIYSGTLCLQTHGQGGEGIEGKGTLRVYHCTIMADCYDDGINTGLRCFINGAYLYCLSHHNDGIDSNGKMTVTSGVVAAISEDPMNESFDTESGKLYLYGGTVIGIGNNEVPVSEQSTICYYSTQLKINGWGRRSGDGIGLQPNSYLTVSNGDNALISLFHQYANSDAFVVAASPYMVKGTIYHISDGDRPIAPDKELLDGRVMLGGSLANWASIHQFKP